MNWKVYKLMFMVTLCLYLTSCNKEDSAGVIVDQALEPYFYLFIEEANKRGLDVDLSASNINGSIQSLGNNTLIGQCIHDPNQYNQVVISLTYWNQASHLEKEMAVFHELGHCYLKRSHLDETVFGRCRSIMHSSDQACRINYNNNTRESYIDELFNP